MAQAARAGDEWFEQFATVAQRLQRALRSAVEELFEVPPRAVDLGRAFELNRTFASRLHRALAAESPHEVARLLPGRSTMTRLLGRMHELCESEETIKELREAYYAYLREAARVASSQQELTAVLDRRDPAAQSKAESKQREAFFRASADLVGASIEVSTSVSIVAPNAQKPQFGDLSQALAYWGFQRTGELDALILASGASERARLEQRDPSVRLDGRPIDEDEQGAVVRELSSHDLPELKTVATNEVAYVARRGEWFPAGVRFDVVVGFRHHCWHRNIRRDEHGSDQFIRRPSLPARLRVSDFLVHRDMWPGITPELVEFQDSDLPVSVNTAEDLARFPEAVTKGRLQRLSAAELGQPAAGAPRHAELVRAVLGHTAVDPDEYRVFRDVTHYPPIGRSSWVLFRR